MKIKRIGRSFVIFFKESIWRIGWWDKGPDLMGAWAKLPVQYLLLRLPDGRFCMVDAMACSMMEGQNAMILQRVTGSDADTPLGAVLRTIEILRER